MCCFDLPLKYLVGAFVNKDKNSQHELYGNSYVSFSALMICALNSTNHVNFICIFVLKLLTYIWFLLLTKLGKLLNTFYQNKLMNESH